MCSEDTEEEMTGMGFEFTIGEEGVENDENADTETEDVADGSEEDDMHRPIGMSGSQLLYPVC